MKRSSFFLAIPVAVVVLVPLQHYMSMKTEPIPPPQGGPLSSQYPNGTKRYYEFDGSYVLSSELVDTTSGKTLSKSFYESRLIDGEYRLVLAGRHDYTLWGRSKWYVFGAVSLWLILALLVFKKKMKFWKNPIAGTLTSVLLGFAVGWIAGQGQGVKPTTTAGAALGDPLAGVLYEPGNPRWKAAEDRLEALVASDPTNYDNLVRMGNLQYDMHKLAEAKGYYERARVIRDDSPDLLTDLGTCYRAVDPRKALELYERAAAMNPNHWQSRFDSMLVLYLDLKDPVGARRQLEELKRLRATVPGIPSLAEWEENLAATGE